MTKLVSFVLVLKRLLVPVCLALLIAPLQRAETFCALKIHIVNPAGGASRSTWVELLNPDHVVIAKKYSAGPDVSFCDFGFGAHSITIAPNECHPLTVSNLFLEIGRPIFLTLQKNNCQGEVEHNGCRIYFRVRAPDKSPLEGVEAEVSEKRENDKSDQYGRLQMFVRAGEQNLKFSKLGFATEALHLTCDDGSDVFRELTLSPK